MNELNESAQADGGLVLAIETSSDVCGVAALRHGVLVSEHTFRHGMHLSEQLITHVDAVLTEAGGVLRDVALFATGIGPGSFTGTRIGVMTAKTLARVLGRPIYGICGLEALALELTGTQETVVPILPCRANTVYAGVYHVAVPRPQLLSGPAAWTIAELAAELQAGASHGIVFCGEGVERYRDDLLSVLPASRFVGFGRGRSPGAANVGVLALERFLQGDPGDDVLAIAPQYISPPPITLPKTGNTVPQREP